MRRRARRLIIIPAAALALVALTLYLLTRFDVVPAPWAKEAGDEVAAADSASAGTPEDGKNGEGDEDEEEVIPVPVELARAERQPISAYYRASSVLEADRHVDLVSRIQGRVQAVNKEEGDWVESGEILAELENGRERIQLRAAELRLTEQVRELERRQSLLEKNLITREEFESTRNAHDLAETERDLARISLEETLIRAPFDGQVTDRKIVPGQHLTLTEPVYTLVDLEPVRIRIHLPEGVARKVSAGDAVLVTTDARPEPLAATVERVSPVVDPATSTVRLTLLMEEGPADVRVGGFVKVRITTDTHTEALAVPKLALVEEGGLRSLFIAQADSVRKVEVRTGLYDEENVEILDGVEEGTFVVFVGQGGLRTGSRIEVLNADSVGWAPQDHELADDDSSATPEEDEAANGAADSTAGGPALAQAS